MSFKSRQKKRVINASKFKNREVMAGRWYLTIVKRKTCCANPACGGILEIGREMVYRHTPREALCKSCADERGIKPRVSTSWEKAQPKRKADRRAY
jgi:hypothetical protein